MNDQSYLGLDPARSRLRATMVALEHEIATLPTANGANGELIAVVARLVDQLALGPEPETRACPKCGSIGMRAANRCSNCWTALEALS